MPIVRRAALALTVAVAALIAAGCTAPPRAPSGPGTPPPTTPAAPPPAAAPTGWEDQMLAAINAARAAAGAPPLAPCATLQAAAANHSADQAANSTMSHTGSDGSTMVQRAERAGYLGWTALAENVAAGYPDVASVMTGWMGSSGHRANILNGSYTHVGVGRAASGGGTLYWTQNLGRSGSC